MINLEKEIREQPAVIASVKDFNRATLDAFAADIACRPPKYVCFAARGTSDHACIYAQYLFGIHTSLFCGLVTPSVITAYGGKPDYSDALVIGVSQSGAAEDVCAVIDRAAQCGAVTVAITNTPDSPVTRKADYTLLCAAGEEKSIAATKTFTSEMYLLASICAILSPDDSLTHLLDGLPDAITRLLNDMPPQIDRMVSRWRYLGDAVVLGRGTCYPIALEGALKILETNRVRMKGYSIADFYHGPIAQMSPDSLAFVIAAKGPLMHDATDIIARLEGIGAEVVVLTDDPELAAKHRFALLLPDAGGDSVSPYLFAVTMQLIALKLTEVRSIDPDSSALIRKVTVTV